MGVVAWEGDRDGWSIGYNTALVTIRGRTITLHYVNVVSDV